MLIERKELKRLSNQSISILLFTFYAMEFDISNLGITIC